LNIITDLIEAFDHDNPNFRPTEIYNENWLLKAFLHQASEAELRNSTFSFTKGSTWFSEALLPTAFRARYRGDHLAETRTNADGVIGHILIGKKGKADLRLLPDARQFVVLAPQSAIDAGTFSKEMGLAGMKRKIQDRVAAYDGDLDPWYQEWAEPTLKAVDLLLVSWEDTIWKLEDVKPEAGETFEKFYDLCLRFK
jgi:hypothetical protein